MYNGYDDILLISTYIANALLPLENETRDITSNRVYDSTVFSSRDISRYRIHTYLGLLRVECFGSLHSLLYGCMVGILKIAKENRLLRS